MESAGRTAHACPGKPPICPGIVIERFANAVLTRFVEPKATGACVVTSGWSRTANGLPGISSATAVFTTEKLLRPGVYGLANLQPPPPANRGRNGAPLTVFCDPLKHVFNQPRCDQPTWDSDHVRGDDAGEYDVPADTEVQP